LVSTSAGGLVTAGGVGATAFGGDGALKVGSGGEAGAFGVLAGGSSWLAEGVA
jgi:hypothetical protein